MKQRLPRQANCRQEGTEAHSAWQSSQVSTKGEWMSPERLSQFVRSAVISG